MIKINPHDAHDRLKFFYSQSMSGDISDCCQDLIQKQPFGKRPFYIFAHPRTDDDGITKRMIWQPRLFKPKAQTNSMLFRVYPPSDKVAVIWILPVREMWSQYEPGKLTSNPTICEFIHDFNNNREKLERIEPDEPTEEDAKDLYRAIIADANRHKLMTRLYGITPGS